jgi:hypothetical protein
VAFKHYTLTLTGVVQRLSDAFGDGIGVINAQKDIAFRQIIISADPASANPVYVGGDNTPAVSSTNHAFSVSPVVGVALGSVQSQSIGPFDLNSIKLSNFFVIGTAGQRLMIGGVVT